MPRPALALAATLLLAGCIVPVPIPIPVGAESWRLSESGGATTLAAGDRLTLTCGPGPRFAVSAPGLDPVASNEELAFGTARASYLLVADVVGQPGPGVAAEAGLDPALLDDLAAGGPISVLYGTQSVGPLTLPDRARETFVARCRARL